MVDDDVSLFLQQKSLKKKPDPCILSRLNSDSSDIQLVTWSVVSLGNTVLKKGYEPWHSNKSLQPEAKASICKSVNSLICLDNKTGIIHKAIIRNGYFGQLKDTKVYLNLKHMPCIDFGGLELSVIHFVIGCSSNFPKGFRHWVFLCISFD